MKGKEKEKECEGKIEREGQATRGKDNKGMIDKELLKREIKQGEYV
jgi:hypothetical protein